MKERLAFESEISRLFPSAEHQQPVEKRIEVDLDLQQARAFLGPRLVRTMRIASGRRGHPTHPGRFRIYERDQSHRSSEYGQCVVNRDGRSRQVETGARACHPDEHYVGAPMPFFQRFHGKEGFHEGKVNRRSHGCIHLSTEDARWLWNWASEGTIVDILAPTQRERRLTGVGRRRVQSAPHDEREFQVSPSPTTTQPGTRPPSFEVGINYPWFKCGWDLGMVPNSLRPRLSRWQMAPRSEIHAWGRRMEWQSCIDQDLAEFKTMGITVVRWFLLADGRNYVPFDATPDGITAFLTDFRLLLETFRRARVKLLPSLMSYGFFAPARGERLFSRSGQPLSAGGRPEVATDDFARRRFFDTVLEPLLSLSLPYRETIYAWELINEPENVTQASSGNLSNPARSVPLAKMQGFIREGVGRINAMGAFSSTVGFTAADSVFTAGSPWRGLGETLHQFHYYGGQPLPRHTFSSAYPCIIGEFATRRDHRGNSLAWPELPPGSQGVISRLNLARSKGYPGAFLWSRYANDDATGDWCETKRELLSRPRR